MNYNALALLMFLGMMAFLATGQRMYGIIGFVGIGSALALWGTHTFTLPFDAAIQTLNWYPLLTLPMFIFMGYMFAETGIANDLYRMFHVWSGPVRGGLALRAIGVVVILAAIPRLCGGRPGGRSSWPRSAAWAWPAWRLARRSRCRRWCDAGTTRSW